MALTLDFSGTKTPTVAGTATFTNASANIGMTNNFAAGDFGKLTTTSALPTNFAINTVYYVIATGLSGSNFQLSATAGGSAITAGSAGTGTQTFTPEQILATDTNNGVLSFEVDTTALALLDTVEFRVYTITLSGGAYGSTWGASYSNPQGKTHKQAPPTPSDIGAMFTIRQMAGTARAFPWKVLRS